MSTYGYNFTFEIEGFFQWQTKFCATNINNVNQQIIVHGVWDTDAINSTLDKEGNIVQKYIKGIVLRIISIFLKDNNKYYNYITMEKTDTLLGLSRIMGTTIIFGEKPNSFSMHFNIVDRIVNFSAIKKIIGELKCKPAGEGEEFIHYTFDDEIFPCESVKSMRGSNNPCHVDFKSQYEALAPQEAATPGGGNKKTKRRRRNKKRHNKTAKRRRRV